MGWSLCSLPFSTAYVLSVNPALILRRDPSTWLFSLLQGFGKCRSCGAMSAGFPRSRSALSLANEICWAEDYPHLIRILRQPAGVQGKSPASAIQRRPAASEKITRQRSTSSQIH